MVEHDGQVGQLLKKLDDLGIAENTIVIWTTDNGAEVFSWPDGGTTPFRGEKNTNWEGGYRVPLVVRWPGVIKPGTEINEIISHEDWLPTLVAAAGQPNVKRDAAEGRPRRRQAVQGSPRRLQPAALLQGRDEGMAAQGVHLLDRRRQSRRPALRATGRWSSWSSAPRDSNVWQDPLVVLRFPKLFDLRADPFERADRGGQGYDHWRIEHAFMLAPGTAVVARWLQSFKEFPPRAKPGSFNLSEVMAKLTAGSR